MNVPRKNPLDPEEPAASYADLMEIYHHVCDHELPQPSAEAFAQWLATDWVDFTDGTRASAQTKGEVIRLALRYWRGTDLAHT